MSEQQRKGRGAVAMGPTAAAVAAGVRRIRERRGWSTYQLAGLLKEAGRPVTPSGIAKLERGERRVDVDDLAALAVVLRVSPSALLLPLDDAQENTLEVTGGGEVPANVAWDWVDGKRPLRVADQDRSAARLEFELYGRPPGRRAQLRDVAAVNERLREAGVPVEEMLRAAGVLPEDDD